MLSHRGLFYDSFSHLAFGTGKRIVGNLEVLGFAKLFAFALAFLPAGLALRAPVLASVL